MFIQRPYGKKNQDYKAPTHGKWIDEVVDNI